MKLRFGCGTGFQEVEVPEKNLMGELHANKVPLGLTGAAEVALVQREAHGVHQVERAAGDAAGARDVAGVLGDFGLEKDHVDLHVERIPRLAAERTPECAPAGSRSHPKAGRSPRKKHIHVRARPC